MGGLWQAQILSSEQQLDDDARAVAAVRDYYDVNTRRWFSRAPEVDTIHRAVWGEGVGTEAEAFQYVNWLILEDVRALTTTFGERSLHVLDLGCGVGASLVYLASHSTVRGTGITISGVQASYAAERIARAGLEDRVQCLEGNYLDLPSSVAPAHAAFSVEAFIHGPDPAAFFAAAAGRTVPAGLLIVCDDFLSERASQPLTTREARTLDDFRAGWHAHSLVTVAEADALATRAGYVRQKRVNLTPFLDLRRPRDLAASVAVKLGRYLPVPARYRQSLVGGTALQSGLASGLIEFTYIVWSLAVPVRS